MTSESKQLTVATGAEGQISLIDCPVGKPLGLRTLGALLDRLDDRDGAVTRESWPANGDRYGFTGKPLDSVTGLQDNSARWYDPMTGRWTSQDPLGFDAGDDNLYRYVGNDPTNVTDPSGLEDQKLPLHVRFKNKDKKEKEIGEIDVSWDDAKMPANKRASSSATFWSNYLGGFPKIKDAAEFVDGAHHFNWYQIVTNDTTPAEGRTVSAVTKKPAVPPHIDGPAGGWLADPKIPGTVDFWLDDLPWYYNEKEAPKGAKGVKPGMMVDPNRNNSDAFWSDKPGRRLEGKIFFKTWLVAVDKEGKLVAFLTPGFSWEFETTDGGKTFQYLNVKEVANRPTKAEYDDLLEPNGFKKD
jgi:RHS repeat-associated protein